MSAEFDLKRSCFGDFMKILVVDDEPLIGSETSEYLSLHGYVSDHCHSCDAAMEILSSDPDIRLVITDLRMPEKDGFTLIEATQPLQRHIEFIVVTGHGGKDEAINAVRTGVSEFLAKPVNHFELLKAVKNAAQKIADHDHELSVKSSLQGKVFAGEKKIDRLLGNLDTSYAELTYCLATASEYKDPETGQHISRIGSYAALIAGLMGWTERKVEMIRLAAPLHDIGKIGTPDSILLKPGKLGDVELRVMRTHSSIGHAILSQSTSPVLKMAANIALAHHERWDGSGYPNGLSAEEIPVEAAITALADVYDALRSKRPYKPALDHRTTCDILLYGDGRTEAKHFSPELLQIFKENHNKFDEIYESMHDQAVSC